MRGALMCGLLAAGAVAQAPTCKFWFPDEGYEFDLCVAVCEMCVYYMRRAGAA